MTRKPARRALLCAKRASQVAAWDGQGFSETSREPLDDDRGSASPCFRGGALSVTRRMCGTGGPSAPAAPGPAPPPGSRPVWGELPGPRPDRARARPELGEGEGVRVSSSFFSFGNEVRVFGTWALQGAPRTGESIVSCVETALRRPLAFPGCRPPSALPPQRQIITWRKREACVCRARLAFDSIFIQIIAQLAFQL